MARTIANYGGTVPGVRYSDDPGKGYNPRPGTAKSAEEINFDIAAARNQANAEAETAKAQGLVEEAHAYEIAAGIAGTSATLEEQATAITRFQQDRKVQETVAGQRADVAAAGFKESGSALSLLRDSISQGAITDALTMVQGNINVGGYLAQQAAATGEQKAALASSAAAQALAKQYADAGVLATSLSANAAALAKADQKEQFEERVNYGVGTYGIPFNATIALKGGGGATYGNSTLVNPAYTGEGGGGGIGTGHVVDVGGGGNPNAGPAVPYGPSAGGGGSTATAPGPGGAVGGDYGAYLDNPIETVE